MLNLNVKKSFKAVFRKNFTKSLESLIPHYNIIKSFYNIILEKEIDFSLNNLKSDMEFIYFDKLIINILNTPIYNTNLSNKLLNFHKIKTKELKEIIEIDKSNKYIRLYTIKHIFFIYNSEKIHRSLLCKKLYNLFDDTQIYEKLFITYLILSQSNYVFDKNDINIFDNEINNSIQLANLLIDVIYLYEKRNNDDFFTKLINFYLKIANKDIMIDIYKVLKLKKLSLEFFIYFVDKFYIAYINNRILDIKSLNNEFIDYEELLNNYKFFNHIRNADIFVSFFENSDDYLKNYKVLKLFEFFLIENINKIGISLLSRIMILVKNYSSELFYVTLVQRFILLLQDKIDINLNEFITLFSRIHNVGYYKYQNQLIEILNKYLNNILTGDLSLESKMSFLRLVLSINIEIDIKILNNLCDEILTKYTFKIEKLKLISLLIINHNNIKKEIKLKAERIMSINSKYTNSIARKSDFEIKVGDKILPSNLISQKVIGPFIIDYFQEPNICIEINGPSHFIGDTSIYTFKHILKTNLLDQMGFKIENISYKDFNLNKN